MKSSRPIEWKEILKQYSLMPKNILSGNIITINNIIKILEKVTCKDFSWHLLNTDPHTPTALQIWFIHYPIFKEASANVWSRIFKLPFKTVRDTKIQTFQYRIIHNIIPWNKWLHNIKIKNSPVCDYCNNVDDLQQYFILCPKVAECWCYWFNWWENLFGIDIRDSQVIEECILFGFPLNNDVMHVLNLLYFICKILYLYTMII